MNSSTTTPAAMMLATAFSTVSCPSSGETVASLTGVGSSGTSSAPALNTSTSSSTSFWVKRPVICPLELMTELMFGALRISPSSTTARRRANSAAPPCCVGRLRPVKRGEAVAALHGEVEGDGRPAPLVPVAAGAGQELAGHLVPLRVRRQHGEVLHLHVLDRTVEDALRRGIEDLAVGVDEPHGGPAGLVRGDGEGAVLVAADVQPRRLQLAAAADLPLGARQRAALLDEPQVIRFVGEDQELQLPQRGGGAAEAFDLLRVGAGHDQLDPVLADAADGDLLGPRRIDPLSDGADHLVHHLGVDLLAAGPVAVDLVHDVRAAGQVDAQLEALAHARPEAAAVGHGDEAVEQERRQPQREHEQHQPQPQRHVLHLPGPAEGPADGERQDEHRGDDQQHHPPGGAGLLDAAVGVAVHRDGATLATPSGAPVTGSVLASSSSNGSGSGAGKSSPASAPSSCTTAASAGAVSAGTAGAAPSAGAASAGEPHARTAASASRAGRAGADSGRVIGGVGLVLSRRHGVGRAG